MRSLFDLFAFALQRQAAGIASAFRLCRRTVRGDAFFVRVIERRSICQ